MQLKQRWVCFFVKCLIRSTTIKFCCLLHWNYRTEMCKIILKLLHVSHQLIKSSMSTFAIGPYTVHHVSRQAVKCKDWSCDMTPKLPLPFWMFLCHMVNVACCMTSNEIHFCLVDKVSAVLLMVLSQECLNVFCSLRSILSPLWDCWEILQGLFGIKAKTECVQHALRTAAIGS